MSVAGSSGENGNVIAGNTGVEPRCFSSPSLADGLSILDMLIVTRLRDIVAMI